MVNINIEIPDDLHKQLKLDSVLGGTTLKQLVIRSLDEEVTARLEGVDLGGR